jgi:hypothetical protein
MPSQDVPTLFGNSGALENRTKTYSMAAAAAGVTLLALAAPAEGKVVITTHINIPVNGTITLDLNHDGVPDVEFYFYRYNPLGAYFTNLSARGLNGGGILGPKQKGWASVLPRSAPIGGSRYFGKYGFMAGRGGSAYSGPNIDGYWGGGQPNRFLGVKFLIQGTTHYGWVRVTVNNSSKRFQLLTATITEYGYETIANKKLLAGLPSTNAKVPQGVTETGRVSGPSLGMLALGAEGLTAWRREELDSNLS